SKGCPPVVVPTAHTSVAVRADTSLIDSTRSPGSGLGTFDHLVPSKCIVVLEGPTAQTSLAETASTAFSRVFGKPGVGVTDQRSPSQCSISMWFRPVPPVSYPPTAQALVEEMATTPKNSSLNDALGASMRLQLEPSQCSTTS